MTDLENKEKPPSADTWPTFEPTWFGRYFLVDRISRGGMSEIFLAKTTGIGGFQKPLVIKKLIPQLSTRPRYVRRFVNEARTLARLNHANIIQVFDMGLTDGEYYIAMEYIEGRNAAHVLSKAKKTERPPSLEFALHVIMEVAKGLAYAHRKEGVTGESLDLVHQDINSFNVMVSYSAEVKIIDFGIARIFLDKERSEALPVAGKLLYFAPEQLLGKKPDRRVDIYGVGALLYEFITGDRLFEHGETANETMKSILETNIAAKIQEDDRIVPALKPILVKATAMNPDDRFGWMEEMIDGLKAAMKECSLELNAAVLSEYMLSQFEKEILIDRRRMRRLIALPAPSLRRQRQLTETGEQGPGERKGGLLPTLLGLEDGSGRPTRSGKGSDGPLKAPIRTIEVGADRTIFQQGDPGQYVYVIQVGRVAIFLDIGQSEYTLAVLSPGDFFGETTFLGEQRRCISARALEQCTLLCLESDAFAELIEGRLSREIIERLVERQKELVSVLAGALLPDPLSRFIHALISLYGRSGRESGREVEIYEIQEMIKMNDEEQMWKYLRKLQSLQIVEARDNKILIKDLAKLENILRMLSGEAKFSLKL